MSLENESQNLPVGNEVGLSKPLSALFGADFLSSGVSSPGNSKFKYEELDKEIINFVIFEKSNREIAQKTGYSIGMIKFRLKELFKRHGVKTKAGLVREIFQKNLFLSLFKE